MPTIPVKRNSRLIWLVSDIRSKGHWTHLIDGIYFGARIQIVSIQKGKSILSTSVLFIRDECLPADTTVPIYNVTTNGFYQSLAQSLAAVRSSQAIYWLKDCAMICMSRKTAINLRMLEDDDRYLIDSPTLEDSDELLQLYAIA